MFHVLFALGDPLHALTAITGDRHILHFAANLSLLFCELLDPLDGVLGGLTRSIGAILLEEPASIAQLFEGFTGLAGRRLTSAPCRLAHGLRRVLELARCLGELLGLVLASEPLELTSGFFGLLGQLALGVARRASATTLLGKSSLPLGRLLLASRELL